MYCPTKADLRPKGPSLGWATFGWANCNIDTFVTLVQHWILLSTLSYNQAPVPGPRFGFMSNQVHQAHIALSGPLTSKDQQSFGSGLVFLDLPSPWFGELELSSLGRLEAERPPASAGLPSVWLTATLTSGPSPAYLTPKGPRLQHWHRCHLCYSTRSRCQV